VRTDRLHRPHDIFVGESRCLSPFRLSGEEDKIVHRDDALEYPVVTHDREPSDLFPFHDWYCNPDGKNGAMAQLSIDPPPTCREFLDLIMSNEDINANVCGNPLQDDSGCCSERSQRFTAAEIVGSIAPDRLLRFDLIPSHENSSRNGGCAGRHTVMDCAAASRLLFEHFTRVYTYASNGGQPHGMKERKKYDVPRRNAIT